MGKFLHVMLYVFAFVGLLCTVAGVYVIGTNSELAGEFMAVRDDFREVPPERRKEVFSELPKRIQFEREVRDDMKALPDERQKALYEELDRSRTSLFENFKKRIHAEAEIARAAKDPAAAVKDIGEKLGDFAVKVDSGRKTGPDNLAPVREARDGVHTAEKAWGEAKKKGSADLTPQALGILRALDKLALEISQARGKPLSSSERDALDDLTQEAKNVLYNVKKDNPKLADNREAGQLLESIPNRLNK
jgi:hypothetical protein